MPTAIKPRDIYTIKGMGGKVYDWRGTPMCPPNGGRIRPLIYVVHIPVISNVKGVGDFFTLARALKDQGYCVQNATDAEGNVAIFTRSDMLAYQARGANQFSTGCENMHLKTTEPWTEFQYRAQAYLAWNHHASYGTPLTMAQLTYGRGIVGVKHRGFTSHKEVSAKAGYNDRTDPGPTFHFNHMFELARFYGKHHRF